MDETEVGSVDALQPAPADQLKQTDVSGRIAGLRGMSWAFGVLMHTGYTASGASKRFSPPLADGKDQSNSKLMYQYLRGDRAPTRGARGRYAFDLVAAVDAHPRGQMATRWLDHPLWMIFDEGTTDRDLEKFLGEDVYPPLFAEFALYKKIPPEVELDARQKMALKLQIFDDFVCVCASFRLGHLAGLKIGNTPPQYALLEFLIPQASRLDPVFRYVQAPFLRMIQDFYL